MKISNGTALKQMTFRPYYIRKYLVPMKSGSPTCRRLVRDDGGTTGLLMALACSPVRAAAGGWPDGRFMKCHVKRPSALAQALALPLCVRSIQFN